MNTKMSSRKGAEIYLEFEIEVAAGTLSNPVCLHGFDPIPLRKVCQCIQERLKEGHKQRCKYTTLCNFRNFHLNMENILFVSGQLVLHNYMAMGRILAQCN